MPTTKADDVSDSPEATTPAATPDTTNGDATEVLAGPPRLVFIDTEATGLDHRVHQLTEVSWIVRYADGSEATRQYFPEHTLDGAEPDALRLTHYEDRIAPQPKVPAAVWLTQLLEDADGAFLVGAVPDFDARHLQLMCQRVGLEPTWDHHLLDVETLALPLLSDVPDGPRSLARTVRALGLEHDDAQAHGALYDARQAMAVYDRVWELVAALRDGKPWPDPVPRTRRVRNGDATAGDADTGTTAATDH